MCKHAWMHVYGCLCVCVPNTALRVFEIFPMDLQKSTKIAQAKKYAQHLEVYYFDVTFAPSTRMRLSRLFLLQVAQNGGMFSKWMSNCPSFMVISRRSLCIKVSSLSAS